MSRAAMKIKKTGDVNAVMVEIRKSLADPKLGIAKDTQKAIKALFEYGLFNKPLDGNDKSRWEALGRLEDNQVIMDGQYPTLDLVILGLQWEGKLMRAQVPNTP